MNLNLICLHSPTVTFISFRRIRWKCSLNMSRNTVTFLLCRRTFSSPLGDSGAVSRKEECYLMVPDQKPHHYPNPLLSERELERFSFRPAAHLFWSFWTCNVEKKCKFLKGQVRNIQSFCSGEKIPCCLVKTCQTSNFGVIQLLVVLMEFCPRSPFYASIMFW